MAYRIATVQKHSPAYDAGILPDDILLFINGEEVLDQVDYQFLIHSARIDARLARPDGTEYQVHIAKAEEAPLGLTFASDLMEHPKQCANRCVFCFIAQQPPGLRPTLYVEDDDWRLSLIMGNYITLTNLPEKEIQRIIARHASPLYISVHTTDPELRVRMMGNPRAAHIMNQLRRFADAGIDFHCQIVACPGFNDGAALDRTIQDLATFAPHVRSIAVVPVGLTRHREGLTQILPFTPDGAQALILQISAWQNKLLPLIGTRLVFAADEFFLKAGISVPESEYYEDYLQIENGIGMLRQFEDSFRFALKMLGQADVMPARLLLATGTSAAPFLRRLVEEASLPGVAVEVRAIRNDFFGDTITVSGLVTGGDLISQLCGSVADRLLLPGNMLRTGEDVFLDGTHLDAVRTALGLPIVVVGPDGGDLLDALCGIAPMEE